MEKKERKTLPCIYSVLFSTRFVSKLIMSTLYNCDCDDIKKKKNIWENKGKTEHPKTIEDSMEKWNQKKGMKKT